MHFLLYEHIIGLGSWGFLTLTTELGSANVPPLPAQSYAYARWHDPSGRSCDRLEVCTRPLSLPALAASLEPARRGCIPAPAFRARIQWLERQFGEGYRQMPAYAGPIGKGLVLLLFGAPIRPYIVRIVDVISGGVVFEQTMDELAIACGLKIPAYLRDSNLDTPVLYTSGNGHAQLALAGSLPLIRFQDSRLVLAKKLPRPAADEDLAISASHVWYRSRETGMTRAVPLADGRAIAPFKSRHGRKGYAGIAAAADAPCFATASEGGIVEVFDDDGPVAALRVSPLVHRSQFSLASAPDGRHLLARAAEHSWLIDIAAGTQALVDDLMPAWSSQDHGADFAPEVRYGPTTQLLPQGLAVLAQGQVRIIPPASLQWHPALPASPPRRTAPAAYKRLLASWRRPAVALRPGRSGKGGRSHLYGVPELPAGVEWPCYEGRPMRLLCQVDLAEAAAVAPGLGLPDQGLLAFFAAENAQGELMDETFEPIGIRVIWLTDATTTTALPTGARCLEPRPLRLSRDRVEVPWGDSVAVQRRGLSSDELAEYQAFLEGRFPDGLPRGHRLGGYPTIVQQNDLEQQAAGDEGHGRPAEAWRLLLQLDSDDALMWGTDSGMLYVLIHQDDLARGDFSRIRAFCEGY